jgi:glucose-1-phosphate cytidylyltransferase
MKAVILAGGLGSRLSEETETRPKPMIEIGSKPILWHIMKIYSGHGITDFIVCLGYKGYVIKEFFANYYLHSCDVTFDLARNAVEVHQSTVERRLPAAPLRVRNHGPLRHWHHVLNAGLAQLDAFRRAPAP